MPVELGGKVYWTMEDIAGYLGVQLNAVRVYRTRSVRNRNAGNPRPGDLPEPDVTFGRSLGWLPKTIKQWQANRPGQGAGGGRPWPSRADDTSET